MKDSAHIAFVSPRFSQGATVGGAETLLRRLAEHLAARGFKVTCLATCAESHFTWENTIPPGKKKIGNLNVEYFPVDEDRDVATFLRIQNSISNEIPVSRQDEERYMQNSVHSQALYEHLRTCGDRYDRILMGPYMFGTTYAASRIFPKKTWLVPCLHDEPFAYMQIMKDMFQSVAGFLFNSEPEKLLAEKLYDFPPESGTVVGMGLDEFSFDADAFKKKHQLDAPYLLYCGRRETLKGTPLLVDYLDAFRARTGKDIKFVSTGSGPVEPGSQLAPHVLDLGFVSEKEKHNAMAGALAFCHPSRLESFGIVILESWLAGRPVLVHAGSDVLKDHCKKSGGGLWFGSYPEFEEELSLLMSNPQLASRMGTAGQTYVRSEYAWPRIEERMVHALTLDK